MATNVSSFLRSLMAKIVALGVDYARPSIPSRTLRDDLKGLVLSDTTGEMRVDYYWSVYVHNGRKPFAMPLGRYLVWFRNPQEDPRLNGGISPRRKEELRHLTPEQFRAGLLANREAERLGHPPPMIVRRAIRTETPPRPFFSNAPGGGMHGFAEHVQRETAGAVRQFIQEELRDLLRPPNEIVLKLRI